MTGRVDATRWPISRVELTRDVGGVEGCELPKNFCECMDSSEAFVDGAVFASRVPPAFDDTFVVTVYFKMSVNTWVSRDGMSE